MIWVEKGGQELGKSIPARAERQRGGEGGWGGRIERMRHLRLGGTTGGRSSPADGMEKNTERNITCSWCVCTDAASGAETNCSNT